MINNETKKADLFTVMEKGIGKKTAERIVLELKDKLNKNDTANLNSPLIYNTLEQDALNALLALGIGRQQAENAIKKIIITEKKFMGNFIFSTEEK